MSTQAKDVIDECLTLLERETQLYLPERYVTRDLKDVDLFTPDQLRRGVLIIVGQGIGAYANWQQREAELGTLRFAVVGYIQAPEKASGADLERAESGLLADWTEWVQQRRDPPLDSLVLQDVTFSGQLDHPIGWWVAKMEARYL